MKYQIITIKKLSASKIKGNILRSSVIEKLFSLDNIYFSAKKKLEKELIKREQKIEIIEKHIVGKYIQAEKDFKERSKLITLNDRELLLQSTLEWLISVQEIEKMIAQSLEKKIKSFMVDNMKDFLMESNLSSNLMEKINKLTTDTMSLNYFKLRLNLKMSSVIQSKIEEKNAKKQIEYLIDDSLDDNNAVIETDLLKIKIDLNKDIDLFLYTLNKVSTMIPTG